VWTVGDPYETYMGRWSRRLAVAFVDWLAAPAGRRWLDVGCGTGALTAAILARAEPAYVWDYAAGMAMLRHFWDAATALDPAAGDLDEGRRFPLCRPQPLRALWTDAGLAGVAVQAIEVPTVFADFDDFWMPFLGGQGPAPAYLMSLPEERRAALRDLLHTRLPAAVDGTIPLVARAWAVQGLIP
jgi:SAM-dependent methyltransferase